MAPPARISDEAESSAPRELRAIQLAIVCAVIGAVTKLTTGLLAGSMAMITSAVDSLGDVLVSLVNMVVIRISDAPPDDEHNYGHAKVEGLGAMFEGGFILAAGGFILYEATRSLWRGPAPPDSLLGIAVMLPLLGLTLFTVTYLRKVAKATGSLVLRADALHYATDVWTNLGVLASLVIVKLTGLAIVDSLISLGIAGYMIYAALQIVREGVNVVMDRSLDAAVVAQVRTLLGGVPEIASFHDLKTRAGKIPHVDFHIVVRPEMTTKAVHDLFLDLQGRVRAIVGASTKVLMHADPLGG